MSRKDRIELQWFPPIFGALRKKKILTTNDASLNFHERSHILGMLKKTDLIEIVKVKPITQFRATDTFRSQDNKALMESLKKTLNPGVIFETPVQGSESIIVDWTKKRNGTPIIRYTSLGKKSFRHDADAEVERQKRLAEISQRQGQAEFSARIRKEYGGRCAITGCSTPAALEAAHIQIYDGADNFASDNGILLRADIHALFDALLFTLTAKGMGLEISDALKDRSYNCLRNATVTKGETPPSGRNISNHRQRFQKREIERKNSRTG